MRGNKTARPKTSHTVGPRCAREHHRIPKNLSLGNRGPTNITRLALSQKKTDNTRFLQSNGCLVLESYITPYHTACAVTGNRIAILAPHPDDEIFGCGASACKWVEQGRTVKTYILTSGVLRHEFAEHPEAEQKRLEKANQRAEESCAAAKVLGLPEPEFCAGQDGELWHDLHIEEELYQQLADDRPTTLVIPSIWEMHRDHRATAELGLRLAQRLDSVEHIAFYEIGVPLTPNVIEDISANQTLKWQAMHCFASQLDAQRYADHINGLNQFRAYTLGLGVTHGEAFYTLPKEDIEAFLTAHQPDQASLALRAAEQQHQQLESTLQQQAERIQQLEQQQQRLYNSRSWRLTAPLRWLQRKLPL